MNWLSRLGQGLSRTSGKLTQGISEIFTKRKLDDETLQELEELLIAADLGPATAARLVAGFSKGRFGKDVTDAEVTDALATEITAILQPYAKPLDIGQGPKPFVILVVGVNGTGKTTTIGKLARRYAEQGKHVILAAGDTFRAAAISQLKIWADRAGVEIVVGEQGGDAASLAFQSIEKAKASGADIVLIDTAGRLHNKGDLMQELAKIVRVIKKLDPSAPHATLLVLDATTGQNAHAQLVVFKEITNVTGLIITKLDGSAKGGVVVSLADKFHLPIHAIGVGEGVDDLQPFDAAEFSRSLLGIASR